MPRLVPLSTSKGAWLTALALLVGVPNQAIAKDKPQIAVVGIHDQNLDESAQTAGVAAIVEALDQTGRLQGLDQDDVALKIQGREPIIVEEAFLGSGRRFLEDGRILHDQAQPEEAVPVLEEAISNLQLGLASTRSTQDLWAAWMYLGTANLSLGDEDAAARAYAEAVALNPDRLPNTSQFPPDVVDFYKRVQGDQVAAARSLKVAADRSGVVIYLNGNEVGQAPVTIERVVPGTNHLVAVGEGRQSYQRVEVTPDTGAIEMVMAAATLGTSSSSRFMRARQTGGLYKAISSLGDVDVVLLAGTRENRLYLQMYSPRNDAFSKEIDIPYTDDPVDEAVAVVKDLAAVVTDDGTISSLATSAQAVPLEVEANALLTQMLLNPKSIEPTANRSRLWLVLGGAGAAAIATGATVFLLSNSAPDPNQGTITIGPIP